MGKKQNQSNNLPSAKRSVQGESRCDDNLFFISLFHFASPTGHLCDFFPRPGVSPGMLPILIRGPSRTHFSLCKAGGNMASFFIWPQFFSVPNLNICQFVLL